MADGRQRADTEPYGRDGRSHKQAMQAAHHLRPKLVDASSHLDGATGERRLLIDASCVVEQALDLTRDALPQSVVLHSMAAAPLVIMADATQLHHLVCALCSNAVRAMQGGGLLKVTLEPRHVPAPCLLSHGALDSGRYAVLTVQDEGSGMDEPTLARIFEPVFTPVSDGCDTEGGLSAVRLAVSRLGGAIDVQSEPRRGSCFSIYLPLS